MTKADGPFPAPRERHVAFAVAASSSSSGPGLVDSLAVVGGVGRYYSDEATSSVSVLSSLPALAPTDAILATLGDLNVSFPQGFVVAASDAEGIWGDVVVESGPSVLLVVSAIFAGTAVALCLISAFFFACRQCVAQARSCCCSYDEDAGAFDPSSSSSFSRWGLRRRRRFDSADPVGLALTAIANGGNGSSGNGLPKEVIAALPTIIFHKKKPRTTDDDASKRKKKKRDEAKKTATTTKLVKISSASTSVGLAGKDEDDEAEEEDEVTVNAVVAAGSDGSIAEPTRCAGIETGATDEAVARSLSSPPRSTTQQPPANADRALTASAAASTSRSITAQEADVAISVAPQALQPSSLSAPPRASSWLDFVRGGSRRNTPVPAGGPVIAAASAEAPTPLAGPSVVEGPSSEHRIFLPPGLDTHIHTHPNQAIVPDSDEDEGDDGRQPKAATAVATAVAAASSTASTSSAGVHRSRSFALFSFSARRQKEAASRSSVVEAPSTASAPDDDDEEDGVHSSSPSLPLFDIDSCPICLSSFEEGERLKVLSCSHCFHSSCAEMWLGGSRRCPLCRAEVLLTPSSASSSSASSTSASASVGLSANSNNSTAASSVAAAAAAVAALADPNNNSNNISPASSRSSSSSSLPGAPGALASTPEAR